MKSILSTFNLQKNQSIIIWIFLFYIFLHKSFELFINKLVVTPFLSHVEQSFVNDLIFALALIMVIARVVRFCKLNYLISDTELLASILTLLVVGYYRLTAIVWDFIPFKALPFLRYVDILLLFLMGNIVIRLIYSKKDNVIDPSKGFYFDNPIKKDDLLNRNNIAKSIASKIENTANPDSSFAIGISSEWGFGKTSFLNLIENNLQQNQKIIVHFNPWLNNDEKSIVNTFFDELSFKLKPYSKTLSTDLLKYAKTINSESISTIKPILSSIFQINDELRNKFDNINNTIRTLAFQIVVFIDDLDRLYESEILEVLRLIRNSANFSNTVFIVAYDRNYLISALNKANEYHPEFYLEKIFQLEFALPAFERKVIKNKLQEQLMPILSPEDKLKFDVILKYCDQTHSDPFGVLYFHLEFLNNIRDVNRFSNSFIIAYETLKGEVHLVDLMNLELLKMRYLGAYNLLVTCFQVFLERKVINKTSYLTLKKSSREIEENKDKSVQVSEDISSNNTELEEYLLLNNKSIGIQKSQIKEVEKYVYAIFPHYSEFSSEKPELLSISNPISVSRYFHCNLLSTNLSEIEFSNHRRKSEEEFQTKIEEWYSEGFGSEISEKLHGITFFENKEDYEKIIRTIFYFATFDNDDNKNPIGFDPENLIKKLDYEKSKYCYSNSDEHHAFVIDVFDNQQKPYMFVSAFIDVVNEKNINSILTKEEIIYFKLKYFESYADQTAVFDIGVFHLFHYCNYIDYTFEENRIHSKKILPEKAKEIFKECAKRLPESFMKNIISKKFAFINEVNHYNILKSSSLLVWGNWDSLESFIWDLDEENIKGLHEFKEFFIQCKAHNFERYIPFDFKELDLSDALLFND